MHWQYSELTACLILLSSQCIGQSSSPGYYTLVMPGGVLRPQQTDSGLQVSSDVQFDVDSVCPICLVSKTRFPIWTINCFAVFLETNTIFCVNCYHQSALTAVTHSGREGTNLVWLTKHGLMNKTLFSDWYIKTPTDHTELNLTAFVHILSVFRIILNVWVFKLRHVSFY